MQLYPSDAGLGVGDTGQVLFQSAQDRTCFAHTASNVNESVLELCLAFTLGGVSFQVGENPAPDTSAIPHFLDEVSGCVQKVGFEAVHERVRELWRGDGDPFAVIVKLKKRAPRRQQGSLAAGLENDTYTDDF